MTNPASEEPSADGVVFTPDEVAAMDAYQRGTGKWAEPFARMHPFTCANRGDGKHRDNGIDLGGLIPTVRGWICQFCDYKQDWAHGFMKAPAAPTGPLTNADETEERK